MWPYWHELKMKLLACAVCLLVALGNGAAVTATPSEDAAASPIVARMVERAIKQRAELLGYSVMRRYALRNDHLSGEASTTALLLYQSGKGKHFSIVHEERATGIVGRVLHNLLKEEEERSRQTSAQDDINNHNYVFALMGKEVQDGRLCYRLKLIPRYKSKFLIEGDLWVDVKEFAIVCVKGRPSKSLSFWISRPFVEQHFQSVNGFWMPSRNQSTAQVRLAGPTGFTIDCWNYKFQVSLDLSGMNRVP